MPWTHRHASELDPTRAASAGEPPEVAAGLKAVARRAADPQQRRFGLLLRPRAVPVRDELLELAALCLGSANGRCTRFTARG